MANELKPPSDLLSPPDDLMSPPSDLQPLASPSPPSSKMPGVGGALESGFREGIAEVGETVGLHEGKDENLAEAQPFEWKDLGHPIERGLPKVAFRLAKSSPALAGGVAGAVAGAPAGPWGALGGGAAGSAVGTFLQSYGPTFRRELAKTPKDPEGAFDRTWKSAAIDSTASAASWAAFGAFNPFKGAIKNVAFQAFGVQPGIAVPATAARNVVQGRPAEEGLGSAYAEGAVDTLVPLAGERLVRGIANITPKRPPPDLQTPPGGPDVMPPGTGPQAGPNGPIPRAEPKAGPQAAPKAEAPKTGWQAKRPGETDRAWKARTSKEDVVDVEPDGTVVEPAPTATAEPKAVWQAPKQLPAPKLTKESVAADLLKAQEEGRLPESARNMFQTMLDQGRVSPAQVADMLAGKPKAAEEPTFKTNPGKIAAEHEAEVSTLETEGTLAARPSSMVETAVRETPSAAKVGPQGAALPQKPWNEIAPADMSSIKDLMSKANNRRTQAFLAIPKKGDKTEATAAHKAATDAFWALSDQVKERYGIDWNDIRKNKPEDIAQIVKDRNDPETVRATEDLADFDSFTQNQPPEKATTLFEEMRELGGIRDDGGNVAQILQGYVNPKFKKSLMRPDGLPPDRMREALQERGWFGGEDRFGSGALETGKYPGDDLQDLYDLMDREVSGEPVYHPEYDQTRGSWAAFEDELNRAGISAGDSFEVKARKLAEFRKEMAAREPQGRVGEEELPGWDDDFLPQKSIFNKPQTEQVGLGADLKRMIDIFGPKMYGANMPDVTAKELFQNSFDAVKSAVQRGDIEPGEGHIHIEVDNKNRTISFSDNGAGMTPETVKKAFLTVAGTDKGDLAVADRSGGFGIAKLAFIFGNNGLKLTTVRDGVKTTLDTNSQELLDGKANLKVERTDGNNGTSVEVTVPKEFKNANGEKEEIRMPYDAGSFNIFRRPLIGDVKVTATTELDRRLGNEPKVLSLGKNQEGLPPKVSTAHFPWGDVDVYLEPARIKHEWQTEPHPEHHVLSSGLHQFSPRIQIKPMDWKLLPYDLVFDIKPKVEASDTYYPFNNQREDFSAKVQNDVSQLIQAIRKQYAAEQAQNTGNDFVNSSAMPITRSGRAEADIVPFEPTNLKQHLPAGAQEYKLPKDISIKNGKILVGDSFRDLAKEAEETKALSADSFKIDPNLVQSARPIFHSNLSKDIITEASERFGIPKANSRHFFATVGTIVQDFRNALAKVPGYEEWSERGHPVGVSLDKSYHGVHIKVPYNAFFLNPLTTKRGTPGAIARDWTHTMIHEGVHTKASGHDENFTSALADLEGAFEEAHPGLRMRLENNIVRLLSDHHETFSVLKDIFNDDATTNLGKNAGITQGSGRPSGLPVGPRNIRGEPPRGVQGPNAGVFGGGNGRIPQGAGRGNLQGPDDLGPQYSKIVPKDGGEGGNEPPPGGGGNEPPAGVPRADAGYYGKEGPTISQWLTQFEDELYRLMNNNKMDKVDALQALWKLPEGHILRDAGTQAKMFHHGEEEGKFAHEQKDHILTPEEAAEWDRVVQPLRELANEEWRNIQPRLSPEQRRMLRGNDTLEGYMHRIVKGKGSEYDTMEGPSDKNDPITGRGGSGRGLGKKAASMHARSPKWMAVGLDGSKIFINGETFTDARGKPQTAEAGAHYKDRNAPGGARVLRPATVEEIEANTPLKYHKNALINTMDNLLKLRRVSRNLDMLNILKADPTFTENSVLKTDMPHPPEGWKSTDVPQLNMYWMNPRMANMFDDYYNIGPKGDLGGLIGNLNAALVRMIFANPVTAFMGHGANVAAHTVMQRGAMNFDPKSWPNSIKNFGKAANEVINMGPIYKALMREGMAGQFASMYARDFHPTAVKIMQGEIEKDPKTWGEIAKIAGTSPKLVYDWLSDVSSKGLWMGSDILLMSHIMDLMEQKNMGVHAAIRDAERGIPNYRIPTEAWEGPGGRAFSELMGNPLITIFGRYRYGMLKAYAYTVKNALAKEGENLEPPPPLRVEHQPRMDLPWGEGEAPSPPSSLPKGEGPAHTSETKWGRKAKAAAELLALFGLMNVVYPELDKAVQKLTKNKHASIRRAGATTIPTAIDAYANEKYKHPQTANDFKDLHSIWSGLWSFPPLMAAAVSLYNNTSPVTGKHVYNPKGDMEEVLQELAGFGATSPFLGQEAAEWATGHKTWEQVVGGFLGFNNPTPAQWAMMRHYAAKDTEADTKAFTRKKAQRRRNLEKKLKGLDKWLGRTINPSGGGT